jgi:adenylate kinase family enzyme
MARWTGGSPPINEAYRSYERGFVALVGPPAVGKSTVSAALVADLTGQVFRLRDFAFSCQTDGRFNRGFFDAVDHLGWFSDETVDMVLRAAFLDGVFGDGGLVVLENFPGSASQLGMIATIAASCGSRLVAVELVADDLTVAERARRRRVCATCEADPRGDPHRPAVVSKESPERCAGCDSILATRRGDEPGLFAARLHRYRRRIPAIRRASRLDGTPYRTVSAEVGPARCAEAVKAQVRSLGFVKSSSV